MLVGYGGLLFLTYVGFTTTPSGFIPSQDKGYLLVNVRLPDSTSVEKTQSVMKHIEASAGRIQGVRHTLAIAGQSILLERQCPQLRGGFYVMLDDFHHRTKPSLSGDAIAQRRRTVLLEEIPDGEITVFGRTPCRGPRHPRGAVSNS